MGWTRAKVTARAKILKLTVVGQQLVGTGEIPLGAIDNLLAVSDVAPAIAQALVDAVAADKIAGSQVAGNPGWAIGQALRHARASAFGAYLNQVHASDLAVLRLGKKTEALVAKAEQLHKQLDRYAYSPPTIRFSEADVDQARAAGVLIEIERSAPVICDRGVYRELCKQAIARTVAELEANVAAPRAGSRAGAAKRDRTPREELDVEHRANLRELTRQAHGVNLDLGAALLNDLAIVPADDMDVARFFAFGLLGPATSGYLATNDHGAVTIAANGMRLVLEEHRTTTTPTLKSGKPGKTKVAYCEPDAAMKWLWKFVGGATTAGELFWGSEAGTGASVVAAEACVGACSVGGGSVRTGWEREVRAGDGAVARCGLRCDPRSSARRSWLLERSRRRV